MVGVRHAVAAALVAVVALAAATAGRAASHPFSTGMALTDETVGPERDVAYRYLQAAGVSFVRITVWWANIAPATRPAGFDPTNPADPAYNWSTIDTAVAGAVAHGLTPYLTIVGAPRWAQRGPPRYAASASDRPDPAALAQFASAVARRYSGSFDGLPRVRYYEVWNEPNLSLFLIPQLVNGRPFAPQLYRRMVNGMSDAVHAVHPDNVVIAGALAPFRDINTVVDPDWGPLSFMRNLLCLSPTLKPTCSDPVRFDVWSQHPYTSGNPTHHASLPNDVSLGDLSKVTKVLAAAEKAHHIVSRRPVGFWVTEFSWDSNPPDPQAAPLRLLMRWVPEALYRMWLAGVEQVTWLAIADSPMWTSVVQSGLYFEGSAGQQLARPSLTADKPKPILETFRFPVVALPQRGGVLVWGRTPGGRPGSVAIEQRIGAGWRRIGTLSPDRWGVFQGLLRVQPRGAVRARLLATGERSVPFALAPVPDHFYNPFGSTSLSSAP